MLMSLSGNIILLSQQHGRWETNDNINCSTSDLQVQNVVPIQIWYMKGRPISLICQWNSDIIEN